MFHPPDEVCFTFKRSEGGCVLPPHPTFCRFMCVTSLCGASIRAQFFSLIRASRETALPVRQEKRGIPREFSQKRWQRRRWRRRNKGFRDLKVLNGSNRKSNLAWTHLSVTFLFLIWQDVQSNLTLECCLNLFNHIYYCHVSKVRHRHYHETHSYFKKCTLRRCHFVVANMFADRRKCKWKCKKKSCTTYVEIFPETIQANQKPRACTCVTNLFNVLLSWSSWCLMTLILLSLSTNTRWHQFSSWLVSIFSVVFDLGNNTFYCASLPTGLCRVFRTADDYICHCFFFEISKLYTLPLLSMWI